MLLGLNLKLPQPVPATTALGPRLLFQSGEQGAWWDPSDLSTLYQDAAGTTPVTAVEQPCSLMLDKRLGLTLGSQRVVNGDFSNGTTSWSPDSGCTLSAASNICTVTTTADSTFAIQQSNVVTLAKWYRVSFTYSVNNTTTFRVRDGATVVWSESGSLTSKDIVLYYLATNSTTFEAGVTGGSVTSFQISNISVRELPGNHAYTPAAASTARPTVSARVNLLEKTEQFDDSYWEKSGTAAITANQETAPNGTLTADLFRCGATAASEIRRTNLSIASGLHTFSLFAKKEASNFVVIQAQDITTSSFQRQWFDLNTGASGSTSSSGTNITLVSSDIVLAKNEFYKCNITVSFTNSTTAGRVNVFLSDANGSFNGTASSGIYTWGADLRVANDGVGIPAYQRVNTATDYDSSGFPVYLRADGSNDYMLTNSIDFGAGPSNPPLGSELVTNGGFDTDTAWAKGTGWTISGGTASVNGAVTSADLDQEISVTDNLFYVVSFEITSLSANGRIYLLSPYFNTAAITTTGTKRFVVQSSTSRPNSIALRALSVDTNAMTATIDNVSVRELLDSSLAPDKMTLCAGVRKLSDAATGIAIELSANSAANANTFRMTGAILTIADYNFASRGSLSLSNAEVSVGSYPSPITNVLTGIGDISGDSAILRVNGTQAASSTADQGTGNYGNYQMFLFMRAGTSLPFNGRFYGGVVRGAQSNDQQIAALENWVNSKCKAF